MNEHDSIRQLVPLAASGELGIEERRLVEAHARECPECGRDLRAYEALASGLSSLPSPTAPPELVERTRSRLRSEIGAASERRWDNAVLLLLTLFTWTLGLATWSIVRLLQGGLLVVWDVEFKQTLIWLTATTVLVWMTAGAAAVMLSRERRLARRRS